MAGVSKKKNNVGGCILIRLLFNWSWLASASHYKVYVINEKRMTGVVTYYMPIYLIQASELL
jgi:hypothetical protein